MEATMEGRAHVELLRRRLGDSELVVVERAVAARKQERAGQALLQRLERERLEKDRVGVEADRKTAERLSKQ
jgi:hypothetical protein